MLHFLTTYITPDPVNAVVIFIGLPGVIIACVIGSVHNYRARYARQPQSR